MERNIVTAKEARDLCESSQIILNRLFEFIKDRAKEGFTKLVYVGIEDLSEKVLDDIVGTLINLGYNVTTIEENETNPESIEITW